MLSIDQLNAVNNMFNGCVVDGSCGHARCNTSPRRHLSESCRENQELGYLQND